jgi:hypothetical protein
MNAVDAVRAARAAGLELEVEGDDLLLAATAPPSASILEMLARHKATVVALLRSGGDGWSALNWWSFFDERADIAESKGGLTRVQAEERAFACCEGEWLNRNFVCSPPGRCFACGGADHTHELLLPFGIEPPGHVWLHSRCWPTWHAGRKADAISALSSMGILNGETRNEY